MSKDKPNKYWSAPALLEETYNKPDSAELTENLKLCRDRLEALAGFNAPAPTTYVVLVLGYWGKGKSLSEAAAKCFEAGGRKQDKAFMYLVQNDPDCCVSDNGSLCYNASANCIRLGGVKSLGALILK